MTDTTSRARAAILRSFFALVLQRRYESISVRDVIEGAGVARSTFYEQFQNKDALLRVSLAGPLTALASLLDEAPPIKVERILQHFQENRAMANSLLAGPMRKHVERVLVDVLETRLNDGPFYVPARLIAQQLAAAQLAAIGAWLRGEARIDSIALAQALLRSARAQVAALRISAEA